MTGTPGGAVVELGGWAAKGPLTGHCQRHPVWDSDTVTGEASV